MPDNNRGFASHIAGCPSLCGVPGGRSGREHTRKGFSALPDSPNAQQRTVREVDGHVGEKDAALGSAGQRYWARMRRLGAVAQILFDDAAASGATLAWELPDEAQLA